MTTKELEEIAAAFRRKILADGGMRGGNLSLILDEFGVVTIDGNISPNSVTTSTDVNDARRSDCIIKLSVDALRALISGRITGTDAVEKGKILIEGDLRVAMALGPAVGDLPTPVNDLSFPFNKDSNE